MSIKIIFYKSIIDKKDEKIIADKDFIYSVEAGEVCSEFIARYFQNEHNGTYKVNINKMIEDNEEGFEFKVFKECKKVRENLIKMNENLQKEIEDNQEIEYYAVLAV